MGSRLKLNPERTFNWFFETSCPVAREKDPEVHFRFPENFDEEESNQTLPKFCFPYDMQKVKPGVAVQHFTFVLTDLEGCQRFGFCRLNNSTHTCLCILSYLPWFEVFYKLLNNLADYLSKRQTTEMKELLAALHKQPIPLPDGSVTLRMVPFFIAPDPRCLPSIPENRNLTELIVAVDVGNLLHLYASMLFERRILIFASKLSTLTSCVHALSAVLFPMYWQHIFIPVLPPHLLDYCCAPMPYLIGVHTSLSETVMCRGLEEAVILNVDTNTLETPFEDLKRIPSDVMSALKVCLKRQAVSPGSGVSQAFLKAQAELFGSYKSALQKKKEGEIHFQKELFLDHKSPRMKQFLQSAVHLQFFKQFIDDRLDILNKGMEPNDLFEEEIKVCETTAGKQKSYNQLVGHLKKGGGTLINNMKTKTNMRAKGLTKSGLKNLLMNKATNEESPLQRGGSVSHRRAQSDSFQNRLPITSHFGMSRPRRPYRKLQENDQTKDFEDPWDGVGYESVSNTDSGMQKDEEEGADSPLCDPEEMDLLGEIFDTLSSRSSHERGLLYGTRSLDLFGPDSHDYITKHDPDNPSQESLSLSISGSGSLQSWNLETTGEMSDVTEDYAWQADDDGGDDLLEACEITEQDDKQKSDIETNQETNVAVNGKQEGREMYNKNTLQEVKLADDKNLNEQESSRSLGVDFLDEITVRTVKGEELKDKKEEEDGLNEKVALRQETQSEINKSGECANKETEKTKEDKSREAKASLSSHLKLNPHHPNCMQDKQDPGKIATISQHPGDFKDLESLEKKSELATQKKEPAEKQPSSPKVQSVLVRFQSESSVKSFQVKPLVNILAPPRDADKKNCSEDPQEEECPPVKVSELKKRFEA